MTLDHGRKQLTARGKLMMPLLVISGPDCSITEESIEMRSQKYLGFREVDDRPCSRDLFRLFDTSYLAGKRITEKKIVRILYFPLQNFREFISAQSTNFCK